MTTLKDPNEPAEVFPPDVCPICGYSLRGSPGEGTCPECGNRYDSSQLILYGWARGRAANPGNSRGRWFLFSILPGFWILYWISHPQFFWGLKVIFGMCWLGPIVFSLLRRQSLDHPGAIQVRMNRKGFSQIDNLPSLRTNPDRVAWTDWVWTSMTLHTADWTAGDNLRLRVRRQVARWSSDYPIDADLICTADQAELVKKLIRRWIDDAWTPR
jgi:hypothetical protein